MDVDSLLLLLAAAILENDGLSVSQESLEKVSELGDGVGFVLTNPEEGKYMINIDEEEALDEYAKGQAFVADSDSADEGN